MSETLIASITSFAIAFVIAILIEAAIEALKPALNWIFEKIRTWANIPAEVDFFLYLSLISGVVLAFIYEIDLVALTDLAESTPIAIFFSGLIIGRGANYLHNVVGQLLDVE